MSSIPQSNEDENQISDFSAKFIEDFRIRKLLFKCNAGKEKGVPVMDIFRYLLCLIFSDRSIYIQRKTGTFGGRLLQSLIRLLWSKRSKYLCRGEKASLNQIYSKNRKRRGRSKYLLSVEVVLDKDGDSLPARLVFVRNKSNRKDWLALLSTDTGLSEEEIIRIYGKNE